MILSYVKSDGQRLSDYFVAHRGFFVGSLQTAKLALVVRDVNGNDSINFVLDKRVGYQIGLNWGGSLLLYKISERQSIRLATSLAASFYSSRNNGTYNSLLNYDAGYAFQIPIVLNYHLGHMSSVDNPDEHGFHFGLGIEINQVTSIEDPVDGLNRQFSRAYFVVDNHDFMQGVVSMGYSYWNRRDKARTLNLQFGFGKTSEFYGTSYSRPSVRLSLHKFVGY